jgi:hypothetical protein
MAAEQRTSLNRPWVIKMSIFLTVFLVLGVWGFWDATSVYPARGINHASYKEFQYLEAAATNHQLDRRASIADPAAELAKIRAMEPARYGPLDPTKRGWLESLEVVGRLTPEYTTIADPEARFKELKEKWLTGGSGPVKAPKHLEWYDIPVQWLITVVGLGGAIWFAMLFVGVGRVKYGWEPATQTLHLPDGNTITPADVEDFDKRKWDKYLIFLKIKPTHTTLGGRELKLDLYRHAPLETWVLDMEKTAFPERAAEESAAAAPDTPPAA